MRTSAVGSITTNSWTQQGVHLAERAPLILPIQGNLSKARMCFKVRIYATASISDGCGS